MQEFPGVRVPAVKVSDEDNKHDVCSMHVFLLGACRDSSCNVMEHRRQGAKQRNNVQWKTKVRAGCQLMMAMFPYA